MKPEKKDNSTKITVVQTVVNALVEKKEIKYRLQNGEDLQKIGKEKGFKVVLPL